MEEMSKCIRIEPTYSKSCIICGETMMDGMICDGCKEAIMHYKKLYMQTKKLTETTKLDEEMFKLLYEVAGIDELIDDDKKSLFPMKPDELVEYIKTAVDEYVSHESWLTQQEGRYDKFIEYVEKRVREAL